MANSHKIISKTMIPSEIQYTYKKQIGFTEQQRQSLLKLQFYDVNVNQFIRQAVKEKLQRDWPMIKKKKNRTKLPF